MITEIQDRVRGVVGDKTIFVNEYRGLSTDTKPSADNGDVYFEMDTKKVYMYNGSTSTWVEI